MKPHRFTRLVLQYQLIQTAKSLARIARILGILHKTSLGWWPISRIYLHNQKTGIQAPTEKFWILCILLCFHSYDEPKASDWPNENPLDRGWREGTRALNLPEPGAYPRPSESDPTGIERLPVKLRQQYMVRGLQVIVKLANI